MKRIMNRVLAGMVVFATAGSGWCLEAVTVDTGLSLVGRPVVMANDSGTKLAIVTGRLVAGLWGITVHFSDDGGNGWSKTHDSVWSEEYTDPDAVWYGDSIYVAGINRWNSEGTDYAALSVQRFDDSGQPDLAFGGSGRVNVSGISTDPIADVALVARNGYLEVFWIAAERLRHSYLLISDPSAGVSHSDIGTVEAAGNLDAVSPEGVATDFFVAFSVPDGELWGWRWDLSAGQAVIDITPHTALHPGNDSVVVSSSGGRIEVMSAPPYDPSLTEIDSVWSDDGGVTWSQNKAALGWDDNGLHVLSPSVVVGPGQTIVTYQIIDDVTEASIWRFQDRLHGGKWSDEVDLTFDTDYIGDPMGLGWTPGAGYFGAYLSHQPSFGSLIFVRFPHLMGDGFDLGDFRNWSAVVGG